MTEARKIELQEKADSLRQKVKTLKKPLKRLVNKKRRLEKKLEATKKEMYKADAVIEAMEKALKSLSAKIEYCDCDCEECVKSESIHGDCQHCIGRYWRAIDPPHRIEGDCIRCDGSMAHP